MPTKTLTSRVIHYKNIFLDVLYCKNVIKRDECSTNTAYIFIMILK